MLGFYENFPQNIHRIENFTSSLSSKKLQERMIQVIHEINRRTFSFEEITHPTVPECTVIFEVGIADAESFNYMDEQETKKVLNALKKKPFQLIDFFCAVRYYKDKAGKKNPLKFDYYMIRTVFGENAMETRVFHERGPIYISPEEIVAFLVNKLNEASARRVLKRFEPPEGENI
jgi:hypothetical protein